MPKKRKLIAIVVCLLSIFLIPVLAQEETQEETAAQEESDERTNIENIDVTGDDLFADIGDVELQQGSGLITPDDFFYFLENFIETVLVGDNPETALNYKEEKIAEFKRMIEEGKADAAKKALAKAEVYADIVEREVSPDLEQRARESSKAVKETLQEVTEGLEGEEWEDIRKAVEEHEEKEDDIAKAAKISAKIKELCEELSTVDPLEYAKVCKTEEDDPEWHRKLDKELTEEQKKEAEQFFRTMSKCLENPRECPCEEFTITKFAEVCSEIAPLAAACEFDGDEEACNKMDSFPDPIDLLPPHLQEAMWAVEEKYRESEFEHHIPQECKEAGATTQDACMKIMFKTHAPPECQEALERGEIDPENEREAREACEKIMFLEYAPEECIEAGLTDHHECEKLMFKLNAPEECLEAGIDPTDRRAWDKCNVITFKSNAPQECLDAGLTGEGRNDGKKCEVIRFKLDAAQECLDAGLTGEGSSDWQKCNAIQFKANAPKECLDAGIDPTDRRAGEKCGLIQFKLNAPQECLDAGLTGKRNSDWRECEKIRFKHDAPQECIDAGLTGTHPDDWRKCDKLRREKEYEEREEGYGNGDAIPYPKPDGAYDKPEDYIDVNCRDGEVKICDNGYCKCIPQEYNNEDRNQEEGEQKEGSDSSGGGGGTDGQQGGGSDGSSSDTPTDEDSGSDSSGNEDSSGSSGSDNSGEERGGDDSSSENVINPS